MRTTAALMKELHINPDNAIRMRKLPLGYEPPTIPNSEVLTLASSTASKLDTTIYNTIEKSEEAGVGSGLLRLLIFEATLYTEVAEVAIMASAQGKHRAAFVLQRSMFEYFVRACSYYREYEAGTDRWKNLVHRVVADERLAGGGKLSERIDAQYQDWKAKGAPSRLPDEPFEKILEREFPQADEENVRFVYQRYRRPAVFAHGGIGAVDDVFIAGEGSDEHSKTSLTIDGDAQLLCIAALTRDFIAFLGMALHINVTKTIEEFSNDFAVIAAEHNTRRTNIE